jgi:hypothetical protein
MPGAPVTPDVRFPAGGGLQWLAGSDAVLTIGAEYGFGDPAAGGVEPGNACPGRAAEVVQAAVAALPPAGSTAGTAAGAAPEGTLADRAARFLDELARRVALGAAAVCTVIDPSLVVLGGEVGLAGGTALASRVAAEVARICPVRPRVVPTAVASEPVLRGALLTAVNQARADLLASVAG